ncbi:MAG: sulfurtransferase [Myxococcaceae bacterium]|nr:sulfurtransferase [Myxococcaceae bacterium]
MTRITLLLAVALSTSALAQDVFISADDALKLAGKDGVRFVAADSEKDFEKGHLPGAVEAFAHDLQLLDDVRKCKGLPMCEATAFDFIGKTLGIDANTQVIAYDAGMGVNASGVWFFLSLYGHKNVRILDGGLAGWKAKGGAVEEGKGKPPAAKAFKGEVQWGMIATRADVEAMVKEPGKGLILDSRHKLEEYTGKELQGGLTAPGKEITVARGGSIPGAVFSPWTKYAGNKDAEAGKPTLKDAKDVQKQLEKLKKNGYDAGKPVITYCHVGLGRGSFQYLALLKAGHTNTKLYVGGWSEWGNTPELPLATQQ